MKYKKILWLSLFMALLCLGGYVYQIVQALKYADDASEGDKEQVSLHMDKAIKSRNSGFLIAIVGTGIFFLTNRSKA
ncbi:MAG: hypothetical protein ACSHYA_04165 [Opitutaceae bacterium]